MSITYIFRERDYIAADKFSDKMEQSILSQNTDIFMFVQSDSRMR